MDHDHWMRNPDGNLQCSPLVGYSSAILPMTGLLRLEFVHSEDQLRKGECEAVQLGMTSPQLKELAQALLKMADRIDGQARGTKQ